MTAVHATALVGLTLETAKTVAVAVVVVFVVGAVASAWLVKTIVQKVATVLVLAALAFAVWTQRDAAQECADAVRENYLDEAADEEPENTECSFFGFTVDISDPRDDGTTE